MCSPSGHVLAMVVSSHTSQEQKLLRVLQPIAGLAGGAPSSFSSLCDDMNLADLWACLDNCLTAVTTCEGLVDKEEKRESRFDIGRPIRGFIIDDVGIARAFPSCDGSIFC